MGVMIDPCDCRLLEHGVWAGKCKHFAGSTGKP